MLIVQVCPTRVRVGAFSAVRFGQACLVFSEFSLSTRRAEKQIRARRLSHRPPLKRWNFYSKLLLVEENEQAKNIEKY